ncbi:MAG: acyl-CoA dehydrogenase family protein [Myxococcales bacterium]|nr:acyl-CoA dehydrogenase family protein [Myxococcales bacterium]MCB9753092.1 acyl-CoA dehydrogenase family protein [Myxococcales bacterium]
MNSPDDFGFEDDAALLKRTARRLLETRASTDALHRLVAGRVDATRECLWDQALWAELVALGWTAIAVPESADGFGMGLPAICGLIEEVGRAALPSPLVATLCATYVLRACDSPAAEALLRRVAEGAAVSLAGTDARGSWEHEDTDVTATSSGGAGSNGQVTLDGVACYVQDAQKAEVFLVKARAPAGVGLYVVDARAPGVTVHPDAILDLTRDQARVELRGVTLPADASVAAAPPDGPRALRAAEPAMLAILAADMVGAAEWQLQTTAEYARTRVQFDRPLGFFQAVKHPLVDMMMKIDEARSLVYDAACSFEHEPAHAELRARMAKSSASDAAAYCSSRSVQLHGGIGFTWECFVHLYFKRQKHNEVLLGDGAYQRAKLADALIGPIGGTRACA